MKIVSFGLKKMTKLSFLTVAVLSISLALLTASTRSHLPLSGLLVPTTATKFWPFKR